MSDRKKKRKKKEIESLLLVLLSYTSGRQDRLSKSFSSKQENVFLSGIP